MQTKLQTPEQIEEDIRLYYKRKDNLNDWDQFDEIVVNLIMLGMYQNQSLQSLQGFDLVKKQFMKRVERKEFPIVRFLAYLNGCAIIC